MSRIKQSTLILDKTTKGAVRYKNVKEGDGEPITVIYLRRSGLTEPYPGSITLTVSTDDDELM